MLKKQQLQLLGKTSVGDPCVPWSLWPLWPDGLFAHKKDGHLSLCMLGLGGDKVVVIFLLRDG